ncbi:MAG: acyl carrier protein [Clostridiales bacterium]|nr:acyl carrier protein [Clostridiales bacterium]
MEKLYEEILSIINNRIISKKGRINLHDNLHENDMDSIAFIRIIVELEETYDFEFDDRSLTSNLFITPKDFCVYIDKIIKSKTV